MYAKVIMYTGNNAVPVLHAVCSLTDLQRIIECPLHEGIAVDDLATDRFLLITKTREFMMVYQYQPDVHQAPRTQSTDESVNPFPLPGRTF